MTLASSSIWFFIYTFLCCLVDLQANAVTINDSPSNLKYFSFSQDTYASFGVYVQPCSQQACCGASSCLATSVQPNGNCSGHAYCGTDVQDACVTGLDEHVMVSILLGLEFACCSSEDLSQCGNTTGQAGAWVTTALPAVTFKLPFSKCYNYPTTDETSTAAWQFVSTDKLNALIRPFCSSDAGGWTLALNTSYNHAIARPAVSDISWSGNNRVDLLYFFGHLAISTTNSAGVVPDGVHPTPRYWYGPSEGIQGGTSCTLTNDVPLPTENPLSQTGCTGACGCFFIELLNKTQTGTLQNPSTLYTFQMCVLCQNFNFSYLQICNAGGLPVNISGGTGICDYSIVNDTKTGCLKWATVNNGCPNFRNGACDILTMTIVGISDGYVFHFEGNAVGSSTTLFPVIIDTSACTCGSHCMLTPAPSPTTVAPTTTQEQTTTPPIPTDSNGVTLPVSTTPEVPATTPVIPTDSDGSTIPITTIDTSAPIYICPDAYAAGPNCDCIFTDGTADQQAWCETVVEGGYVWKLEYPSDVPNPPESGGWYKPGTTDSQGYKLSCACEKLILPCPACNGTTCVCNSATGQCVNNAVCNIAITSLPEGTCAACPVDASGNACSNRGVCDCGTCVCGEVIGQNYTGAACEQRTVSGCAQFADCASCRTAGQILSCTWCNTGHSARCLSGGSCKNVGSPVDCYGAVVLEAKTCPNNNNCSGQGQCLVGSSITQCVCNQGFHGSDCSARGGVSAVRKAAAIAGGLTAVVVIWGVILLAALAYGSKKGVDWMQLNRAEAARSRRAPSKVNNHSNNMINQGK